MVIQPDLPRGGDVKGQAGARRLLLKQTVFVFQILGRQPYVGQQIWVDPPIIQELTKYVPVNLLFFVIAKRASN